MIDLENPSLYVTNDNREILVFYYAENGDLIGVVNDPKEGCISETLNPETDVVLKSDRRELLTPDEAASRLKVSRQHVVRMVKDGALEGVQVSPRIVRVFKDSVDKLFRS